jgi:esterase/lipase superfamily enzyme
MENSGMKHSLRGAVVSAPVVIASSVTLSPKSLDGLQHLSPVYVRVLLTIVLLAVSIPSMTQSTQSKPSQTPSIQALTARREALEQNVAALRAAGASESSIQLKSLEGQLLEATGEEDDSRQQLPEASKSSRQTSFISVPVYYATDRSRTGGKLGNELSSQGVEYGLAISTLGLTYGVRSDLILGTYSLPQTTSISGVKERPFADIEPLRKSMRENSHDLRGNQRRLLLFVHGYNTSFSDAINAAARLATEVQFPVIPVAYSWPSAGSYSGYWHDEDTVRASALRFELFLGDLLSNSPIPVTIVCHSMGAREVTAALRALSIRHANLRALQSVVFAASDIYVTEFNEVWPDLVGIPNVRFAFYVSNHDLALRLSHIVHQVPRLGDASPQIYAPIGGQTIDASAVDSIFQAAGHSYILYSPKIGADLGTWIDTDISPTAPSRDLIKVTHSGQSYFIFP